MGFKLDAWIGVGQEGDDERNVFLAACPERFAEFAQADLNADGVGALEQCGEVRSVVGATAQ